MTARIIQSVVRLLLPTGVGLFATLGPASPKQIPGESSWEAWKVEPKPMIEIGVLEGPEEYVLTNPIGVVGMKNGRTVVALYSRNFFELRYYSSEGAFLDRVGHWGEGPYEVSDFVSFVGRLPGDSILVTSTDNRYSVFGPNGERVRSSRFSIDGLHSFSSLIDRSHLALIQPHESGRFQDRLLDTQWVFCTLDLITGAVDTLGIESNRELWHSSDGWVFPAPFPAAIEWAGGAGIFWFGSSDRKSIRRLVPGSGASVDIEISIPRSPVTREMRTAFLDWQKGGVTGDRLRRLERYHRRIEFPDSLPVFQDLTTDELGNLWVLRYLPPWSKEDYEWDVYDPRGNKVAMATAQYGVLHGCVRQNTCPLDMYALGDDYLLSIQEEGAYRVRVVKKYRLIKRRRG